MFWYYLFLLGLTLFLHFDKGVYKKNSKLFLYYILPLFICFGYMIGADWRMYEVEFYDISQKLSVKEPSYYILAQSFKSIGFGFLEFSILYKIVGYFVFLHIYLKYSKNILWGLIYSFPNYALFLWMDHPARNFVAIIIFSFSFKYIEKGEFWKFWGIYLLSSSFHATCLVMLPIYYLVRQTPNRKYIVWLAVVVISFFAAELMRVYLAPVLDVLNMAERMQGYMLEEDTASHMSIIRFLIFFIFLLLASLNIDNIRIKVKYADFILKLSFIYVFFFCIGNIHNIFFDFSIS